MAISYPVDVVNTRWAVLQLSSGEIIARNKVWPVADGSEIVGLDPDYVYLLHVNATPPDYDSRLFTLQGTETVDAADNELRLNWSTVARPVEERTEAAKNEEGYRLGLIVDLQREAVKTRLMVGALLSWMIDNNAPPQKVRDLAGVYITDTVKVWQNRDRLQEILDDIAQGIEPDLDAGWAA